MFSRMDNKDGKKCNVVPCWNILKEEDKWKAKRTELQEMEKDQEEGHEGGSDKGRGSCHQ